MKQKMHSMSSNDILLLMGLIKVYDWFNKVHKVAWTHIQFCTN